MAHAIGMRATSLVASAALLGAAVLAGLTMKIVHDSAAPIIDGPRIDMVVNPPVERPRETPAQPPTVAEPEVLQPYLAAQPTEPTTTAPIATAQPIASYGPPTILDPEWVRVPRNLARYYPARALDRGMEGSVTLNCLVTTVGALNCAVVSETPANWGFGDAALRISRDYRMVPASQNGEAIEARHRMVIPFRLN